MNLRGALDLSEMERVFGVLKARHANYKKPFTETGKHAREEFKARFEATGPGWVPNKAGTRTLYKTGDLESSYVDLGATGNVSIVGRTEASFGSNLSYAGVHQTGGTLILQTKDGKGRPITVPARPVVVPPGIAFQAQLALVAAQHLTIRKGERS